MQGACPRPVSQVQPIRVLSRARNRQTLSRLICKRPSPTVALIQASVAERPVALRPVRKRGEHEDGNHPGSESGTSENADLSHLRQANAGAKQFAGQDVPQSATGHIRLRLRAHDRGHRRRHELGARSWGVLCHTLFRVIRSIGLIAAVGNVVGSRPKIGNSPYESNGPVSLPLRQPHIVVEQRLYLSTVDSSCPRRRPIASKNARVA